MSKHCTSTNLDIWILNISHMNAYYISVKYKAKSMSHNLSPLRNFGTLRLNYKDQL